MIQNCLEFSNLHHIWNQHKFMMQLNDTGGGEPVTMILCVNQAWSHCTHLNNICCSRENISQSKLKRFNYPELSQSKQLLTIRNNKIDSFESMKRRFWTFLQIKRNVRKQRLSLFYWSPFGTRQGQWKVGTSGEWILSKNASVH